MNIIAIKQYLVTAANKELLIIKVETDEDIFGIGEATLRVKNLAVMECVKLLEKKLIGKSVFEIEKTFFELFYHDRWRNGVIMNTALSGIEMAMLDAIGKKLNVPVYNLLGGKVRDKVLLYVNGWQDLDGLSAVENAKIMVSKGFKAMKWNPIPEVDVCAPDYHLLSKKAIDQAILEVRDVRSAVGEDIELFVECHGRLDYDESLRLAKAIEPYRIGFIEEPMQPDNVIGFNNLVNKINIPIAAGERMFTRWGHIKMYQEGFLSVSQPDFTHCGGLLEAKKMSSLAETFYLKIAPHNSSGPIATIASGQVDITLPNFYMQEFVYKKNIEANEKYFKKSLVIEDGYMILDKKAGLGIEVDFGALEAAMINDSNAFKSDW